MKVRIWNRLRAFFYRLMLKVWNGPRFPNVYVMIHSVYLPRAIYVVAELGIADLLKESPQSIADLANKTQMHERSLYRIMRLLAAYDVFQEDRNGNFRLAKLGKTLLSDEPESMRWWAMSLGNELWDSNTHILDSIQSGKPGFCFAHQQKLWDWYPQNPEAHDVFLRGMAEFTNMHAQRLVQFYDFRPCRKVVDVGGGGGALICAILNANPHLEGILFDQPETIANDGLPRIRSLGLAPRCEAIGGSFLTQIPSGGDCYLLKHVLRDWDDDHATQILKNCRRAIHAEGRLLIVDAILNPENGNDRLLKLVDIQLMVDTGGGLRTKQEFETMLKEAGFRIHRIHQTPSLDAHLIEARPIPNHANANAEARKGQVDSTSAVIPG